MGSVQRGSPEPYVASGVGKGLSELRDTVRIWFFHISSFVVVPRIELKTSHLLSKYPITELRPWPRNCACKVWKIHTKSI